jgi:hypothetical protein
MIKSLKSFLTSTTLTIPAGTTVERNCTGQLFICKEGNGSFEISFNGGEFFLMEVGLGFRLNGQEEYTKLAFRNTSSSDIAVTFYTGVGEIRDARLNTMIERLMIVGLKDLSDYNRGSGAKTATADYTTGNTWIGVDIATTRQRKQIVIQNTDTTGYLCIGDWNRTDMAIISPGQSWTMQSSATYKVRAHIETTCSYYVCETFYNL